MDGFTVNKIFHCRELGLINVNKDVGISYHFNTGLNWSDLSLKDRKKLCMRVPPHREITVHG